MHLHSPVQVQIQPENFLAQFGPEIDQKMHRTPVQFAPEMCEPAPGRAGQSPAMRIGGGETHIQFTIV